MEDLTTRLNELHKARTELDMILIKKNEMIDSVTPAEVKLKILDVKAELDPVIAGTEKHIAKLESDIKADVIGLGKTATGENLQAVYNKGRVSWNTSALDGLAVSMPELAKFKKEGDPYVTIKRL
jgi:hypothetical protein